MLHVKRVFEQPLQDFGPKLGGGGTRHFMALPSMYLPSCPFQTIIRLKSSRVRRPIECNILCSVGLSTLCSVGLSTLCSVGLSTLRVCP